MNYIMILLSVLILSSCKYNVTFSKLNSLEDSKNRVEKVASENITAENQVILKKYFSTIKNITYEFLSNTKMQEYTHKKFSKYFNENKCNNILLSAKVYKDILNKCTVNGFYICSDEVRAYQKVLISAKGLLRKNELKNILDNQSCKEKLVNLGVINE